MKDYEINKRVWQEKVKNSITVTREWNEVTIQFPSAEKKTLYVEGDRNKIEWINNVTDDNP